MKEVLKTTYLTEKPKDILRKINELAYKKFILDPDGRELLQNLFDYYLVYISAMQDGSHPDAISIGHTIGMQDCIRNLHNHAKSGEELTNKIKEESK